MQVSALTEIGLEFFIINIYQIEFAYRTIGDRIRLIKLGVDHICYMQINASSKTHDCNILDNAVEKYAFEEIDRLIEPSYKESVMQRFYVLLNVNMNKPLNRKINFK